jgi:hypothetical protein
MFRLFNKQTSDDRMLGKEDILDTFLLYMKQRGNSRSVLRRRLEALLQAYNPQCGKNLTGSFPLGIYIDEHCSDEKLQEIQEITGFKLGEDPHDPFASVYRHRRDMFQALLMYRVKIEEIHNAYEGILECSSGFMNGAIHVKNLNKEIMATVAEKVDRVLFLLLGDKYDEKVSLVDLKKNFGYPSISDEELREMIIDEMPD